MSSFIFDEEKAVSVVLFILKNVKKIGKHSLAKVLYFADQKHLVRYGRPIIGDDYIKMPYGPVPSAIYDGVKRNGMYKILEGAIEVKGNDIYPKLEPDMDELSESDIECLGQSIDENVHLSFGELKDKSHQLAWNSAQSSNSLNIQNIAKEGGACEDMLNHICESINDVNLARRYGLIG